MKKKLMNFVSNLNNAFLKRTLRKIASDKQVSFYQFNDLVRKNQNFAIFSNTEKTSKLVSDAIKSNIIKNDTPVIVFDSHIPELSTNHHDLDTFDFSDIEIVYCHTISKPNASDIDLLYQTMTKKNSNITFMDNTAFPKNHSNMLYKFRGLTYSIDSKTVIPAHFIVDFYINELKRLTESFDKKINMLDMCAGQGCIGLSTMNECENISNLLLAEISKYEIQQMQKTLQLNKLSQVKIIQSDVFDNISKNSTFDLISCNPPHFDINDDDDITKLQRADKDWKFHKKFLGSVSQFLNPSGIVTLIENKDGSTQETFKNMFSEDVKIIDVKDVINTQFYIIYAQKT